MPPGIVVMVTPDTLSRPPSRKTSDNMHDERRGDLMERPDGGHPQVDFASQDEVVYVQPPSRPPRREAPPLQPGSTGAMMRALDHDLATPRDIFAQVKRDAKTYGWSTRQATEVFDKWKQRRRQLRRKEQRELDHLRMSQGGRLGPRQAAQRLRQITQCAASLSASMRGVSQSRGVHREIPGVEFKYDHDEAVMGTFKQSLAHSKRAWSGLASAFEVDLTEHEKLLRRLVKESGLTLPDVELIYAEFLQFDDDQSGSIDIDELRRLVSAVHKDSEPTSQQLAAAWRYVDGDADGRITFMEFFDWYSRECLNDDEDSKSHSEDASPIKSEGFIALPKTERVYGVHFEEPPRGPRPKRIAPSRNPLAWNPAAHLDGYISSQIEMPRSISSHRTKSRPRPAKVTSGVRRISQFKQT